LLQVCEASKCNSLASRGPQGLQKGPHPQFNQNRLNMAVK